MFFTTLGSGEPSRLFVGGIHGNEEATTVPVLRRFAQDVKIKKGRLILCGLSGGDPYISTLEKTYYDSETGKKLLDLIREYRPCIYLELHSYRLENHAKLTDPERKNRTGVPPFTELEEKVLIGSVSPLIRTTEFRVEDFCFTLEIPSPHSGEALQTALAVMRVIASSDTRDDIISKLRMQYPEAIGQAEKNFLEFLRERKLSLF